MDKLDYLELLRRTDDTNNAKVKSWNGASLPARVPSRPPVATSTLVMCCMVADTAKPLLSCAVPPTLPRSRWRFL